MTFEQLLKANETIVTTDVKGKEYAEVPQRIKAFRMCYPDGFITTELLSDENGVCKFIAKVGYYTEDGVGVVLGTGTAYEKEGSTFINKTSYIENCETSAVGRALGMCGFGIDTSVASAEEVQNAINNQNEQKPTQEQKPTIKAKATPKQMEILSKVYVGDNLTKLLNANNITKLEDMPISKASDLIKKLKEKNNG